MPKIKIISNFTNGSTPVSVNGGAVNDIPHNVEVEVSAGELSVLRTARLEGMTLEVEGVVAEQEDSEQVTEKRAVTEPPRPGRPGTVEQEEGVTTTADMKGKGPGDAARADAGAKGASDAAAVKAQQSEGDAAKDEAADTAKADADAKADLAEKARVASEAQARADQAAATKLKRAPRRKPAPKAGAAPKPRAAKAPKKA